MSDTKKPEDVIAEARFDDLRVKANVIFESLVLGGEHGKLPEVIFKEYFLPYFSGQKPLEQTVLTEWISIAGSPMAEVDLLDPAGNIVGTVPGIYSTKPFEVATREAGHSIADIVNTYDLKNHSLPIVANNYLNSALDSKVKEISKDVSDSSSDSRWEGILSRYGIQTTNTPVKKDTDTDSADDLVYE